MTASNDRILSRMESCSKVILLMGDDIGSVKGQLISKCPFGPNDEIKRIF